MNKDKVMDVWYKLTMTGAVLGNPVVTGRDVPRLAGERGIRLSGEGGRRTECSGNTASVEVEGNASV